MPEHVGKSRQGQSSTRVQGRPLERRLILVRFLLGDGAEFICGLWTPGPLRMTVYSRTRPAPPRTLWRRQPSFRRKSIRRSNHALGLPPFVQAFLVSGAGLVLASGLQTIGAV